MNVQAAEHAQDARRLRSIETQLTALGLVDDDRFGRRRFPGPPGAGAPQVDRLGVVAHRHAL